MIRTKIGHRTRSLSDLIYPVEQQFKDYVEMMEFFRKRHFMSTVTDRGGVVEVIHNDDTCVSFTYTWKEVKEDMKVRITRTVRDGSVAWGWELPKTSFDSQEEMMAFIRKARSQAREITMVDGKVVCAYKGYPKVTYHYEFIKEEPMTRRKFVVAQPAPEPVENPTELFLRERESGDIELVFRKGATEAVGAVFSSGSRGTLSLFLKTLSPVQASTLRVLVDGAGTIKTSKIGF